MNEDYLTSYFNDDFAKSMLSLQQSMNVFLKNLSPIQESIKPLLSVINEQYSEPFNSTASVNNLIKTIKNMPFYNSEDEVFGSIKQITCYVSEINSPIINKKKLNYSFNYLVKDDFISTNKNVQHNGSPVDSKRKIDEKIESKKINALRESFYKFAIACKNFKEFLDFKHDISSPVDRILSNFGFSSALSELITLIKPNDPLFTIVVFFIMGVFQEMFQEK